MNNTFAIDIWNTGQTFTETGARTALLHEGRQFRNAHRIETTDPQGRPWTVRWTRVAWEAKAGRYSVLSVLCVAAPTRALCGHTVTSQPVPDGTGHDCGTPAA